MDVNLCAMMDCAMWRFLSSGMYRSYLSIGKNRTSARRNLKNLVLAYENLGATHERKI